MFKNTQINLFLVNDFKKSYICTFTKYKNHTFYPIPRYIPIHPVFIHDDHRIMLCMKKCIIYSPLFITKFALYFEFCAFFIPKWKCWSHFLHSSTYTSNEFILDGTITIRRVTWYMMMMMSRGVMLRGRTLLWRQPRNRQIWWTGFYIFRPKYHFAPLGTPPPPQNQFCNRCLGHNDAPRIRWLISGQSWGAGGGSLRPLSLTLFSGSFACFPPH